MAMTPYSQSPLVISILGTTPQERGLETQQFKAKFDEGLKEFTEWFNATHKTEFELVQTDLATHLAENVAYQGYVVRNLTIAGVQQVRGLGFKPKIIIVNSYVYGSFNNGTPTKWSDGYATENGNKCKLSTETGGLLQDNTKSIRICDAAGANETVGVISFVNDGFDITWTKVGTGATGNVEIIFLAQTH